MARPLIIAHRALVPGGTENTVGGIILATAAGADLIELDIRLSLDHQPVVLHDAFLHRTARMGRGWVGLVPTPVVTRLRLRTVDGEIERVPRLRQVLQRRPLGPRLALHLKDRRALKPVLGLVERDGTPSRTWLWLEHPDDVHLATRALPEVRCTLLRPGAQTDDARERYFIEAQFAGASAVSVPWGAVDERLVTLARQHNLLVFAREIATHPFAPAIAAGLDGIITSDPAAARARLAAIVL